MTDVTTQIKNLPVKRIENISVDLTRATEVSSKLLEQAKRAKITDAETYATGGDLIKIAATSAKKYDEMRKELSGPFHTMWKFLNGEFKKVADEFAAIRAEIEPKMLAWKKAEDEKLRKEAEEKAKRLEEEALERAALEQTDEGQDEVMEAAAEASETMVEDAGVALQRGNYGSSTGTSKKYTTNIENQIDFLRAIIKHIDDGNERNIQIGSIVELRKAGLNQLAKEMRKQGVKKMPGAVFTESDSLRVY